MEPVFEEQIDEYFEPDFGLLVNGPIFFAKENNASSEQTFLVTVAIQTVPFGRGIEPATLNDDYRLSASGTSVVVQHFDPTVQRISFQFTLLPDSLHEGTEGFLVSSGPGDAAQLPDGTIVSVSTYLPPTSESLSEQSLIVIKDDDRKLEYRVSYSNGRSIVLTLYA